MSEVADLFATLGLRVKSSEWSKGDDAIRRTSKSLDGVGGAADKAGRRGAGAFARLGGYVEQAGRQAQVATALIGGAFAYFGQRAVRTGVELNATLEDSKNKVAGLMSLARHSDFNAELANAGMLMTNLERAAAKLPGETSDYVEMLSLIAQPVAQAKLGLKELEQLTISATSTALTMHIDPGQAARDIEGALNGVFNSRDRFTGPLLAARGFSGEEGRARFNQLDAAKRAKEVMAAFDAPQLKAMGAALGNSFSGVLSTLMDAWHRLERAIAKPLFDALTVKIKELNEWLDKNDEKVQAFAKSIGDALLTAFNALIGAFQFFLDHGDAVIAILVTIGALMTAMAIKSIIALWPLYAIAAVVGLIAYGIIKLVKHWDDVKDAARAAGEAIKRAFVAALNAIAGLPIIAELLAIIDAADRLLGKSRTKEQQAPIDQQADALRAQGINVGGQRSGIDSYFARQNQVPTIAGKPTTGAPGGGLTVNGGVNVNVNSPNSDPGAVADAVGKHFDNKMGVMLREAHDVVSP